MGSLLAFEAALLQAGADGAAENRLVGIVDNELIVAVGAAIKTRQAGLEKRKEKERESLNRGRGEGY